MIFTSEGCRSFDITFLRWMWWWNGSWSERLVIGLKRGYETHDEGLIVSPNHGIDAHRSRVYDRRRSRRWSITNRRRLRRRSIVDRRRLRRKRRNVVMKMQE